MGGKPKDLTVEELNSCSPDAIDAVAASWERLGNAMDGDKGRLEAEVLAPLRGSWVSRDGERAIELLGYVGAQLQAVRQESWAMSTILREAAAELRAAQNDLRSALQDLAVNHMTRHPDGSITWQTVSSAQQDFLTAKGTEVANRLAGALRRATDADALAAATMNANVDSLKGNAKNNFNDWALGAEPAADARRVADLLAKLKTGARLSDEEMAYVRLLTQDNAGDRVFKTNLMLDVGPEGLLHITRATTRPAMYPDMEKGDLQFIENTLRDALSASSAELAKNTTWMEQLKKEGRENYGGDKFGGGGKFGYQDLDVLLRQGTYDTGFLTQVGEDLLRTDQVLGDGRGWGAKGAQDDPVTGFMVTLKNNPDAATAFFSGPDGQAHVAQVALEHVAMDPYMTGVTRPQLAAFGDAVVAATTGRPTTPAMADVVGNVVNTLGAKDVPQVLEQSGDLRRDVTEMLAKNAESLHLALTQESAAKNVNAIPVTGPTAAIAREAMQRVLADFAVTDPSNIEVLKEAEERYARLGLTMTLNTPGYPDAGTRNAFVQNFAHDAGEAFGVLDSAVTEELRKNGASGKDALNVTEGRIERWAQFAVTAGVTTTVVLATVHAPATAPISPWFGFTLGTAGTTVNAAIGEFFDYDQPSDESAGPIHDVYTNGQTQVENLVTEWENGNRASGDNPGGYSGPALTTQAGDGYTDNLHPELRPR